MVSSAACSCAATPDARLSMAAACTSSRWGCKHQLRCIRQWFVDSSCRAPRMAPRHDSCESWHMLLPPSPPTCVAFCPSRK